MKNAESLAKKKELIDSFDIEKWESAISASANDFSKLDESAKKTIKEVEQNIQVELNVINKMYDKNDAIFVVDIHGNVVSKNLDGIFRNINLSNELLIKTVLQGLSDWDVMKILDKTYFVSAAPIEKNGKLIGAYCSANNVNSENAKDAANSLFDNTAFDSDAVYYFGFFDKHSLLGSTMPTEIHESFKTFIKDNQDLIKKIDSEGTKTHEMKISLRGETFYSAISRHPSLSETNDIFYITLISRNKVISPVKARHGTIGLILFFIVIAGLVFSFVFDEQFNRPINKFMENMLEIINGNVRYRFNNDAEGVEGNLNQNANMMIATLLGEKIPEKENLDKPENE